VRKQSDVQDDNFKNQDAKHVTFKDGTESTKDGKFCRILKMSVTDEMDKKDIESLRFSVKAEASHF